MIEAVIILGGHVQALGLARQAHGEGVRTILVVRDSYSVARFSNAVDKTIVCSDEQLLDVLKQHQNPNTLLFPTSDDYIEFIDNHRPILEQSFQLGIPSQDCVRLFSDKKLAYQYCEARNIPHPKCYYPETMDDVAGMDKSIEFPIVVKPRIMYSFHEQFGKKAFLCKNHEELMNVCSNITNSGYTLDGLILQEFLSGGPASLFSYGVFAVEGRPIAWLQANRIRQNPMMFGNSTTFAIACSHPEIEEQSKRILKEMDYTGLAEVEYMFDEKSGQYKFLEINTRAWKWHTLSEAFGFGFLSEMLRYYNEKTRQFHPIMERRAWVERLTDYAVVFKGVIKGQLSIKQVRDSYLIPKVSAVWSWHDPMPAIMYILLSPVLYFKRH